MFDSSLPVSSYDTTTLNLDEINRYKDRLLNHPLFTESYINSNEAIRIFMQNHAFAVWDFMTLVKYLQQITSTITIPWYPSNVPGYITRFINEIVLDEESDITPINGEYLSHFELYLKGMKELNCDTQPILNFISSVNSVYVSPKDLSNNIPLGALNFVNQTMDFVGSKKPHVVAAAFAFGRETVIPGMFKKALKRLEISNVDAPYFHFYLERHIEVDGGSHGDYSLRLLEYLCDDNPQNIQEANNAAIKAIKSRIALWDSVINQL